MKKIWLSRICCDLAFAFAIFVSAVPLRYSIWQVGAVYALICALAAAAYFVIKKDGLRRPAYGAQVGRFKPQAGILFGALVISFIEDRLSDFENIAIPFILIFLVLSVFLMRSLRYLDYHQDSRELNRLNYRYAAVAALLLVTLSVRAVRETVCNLIVNAVAGLLYFIVMGLAYALQQLILSVAYLVSKNHARYETMQPPAMSSETLGKAAKSSFMDSLTLSPALGMALKAVAVVLIATLIIWFAVRAFKALYPGIHKPAYAESREFISPAKIVSAVTHKSPKGAARRGYAGTIRQYYSKFLKLCSEKEIDIRQSDTTLEIDEKFMKKLNIQKASGLRRVYLRVRYGGDEASKALADEFVSEYRQIKRQAGAKP